MSRRDDVARLQHRAALTDLAGLRDELAELRSQHAATLRRVSAAEKELASEKRRRGELERSIAQLPATAETADTGVPVRDRLLALGHRARPLARPVVDTARRVRRDIPRILVVCPAYPDGPGSYGGQFVRARVQRYRELGLDVLVYVASSMQGSLRHSEREGIQVWSGPVGRVRDIVGRSNPDVVGVHHPEPALWSELSKLPSSLPVVAWIHGYEARSWRELRFNHPDADAAMRARLDQVDAERRRTISQVFQRPNTDVIFVSDFMRGVAEDFAARKAPRAHTIPNVVDPETFPAAERAASDRFKVLWVRSFARHNYANDLARDAVLRLSRTDAFERFTFTIVGDGTLFDEMVEPLEDFPNVSCSRRFVDSEELSLLHRRHGVILAPTRWDSQGLTPQEGMSSGLVPITNDVAAIPEFIPPDIGLLCPPEDAGAIVDALLWLDTHPTEYVERSRRAPSGIQATCAPELTVGREVDLIRAVIPRLPRPRVRPMSQ